MARIENYANMWAGYLVPGRAHEGIWIPRCWAAQSLYGLLLRAWRTHDSQTFRKGDD